MANRKKLTQGMVHVYTGDGKGKTTAALGLALRARGHGLRVYMIQFMKGDPHYGELQAAAGFDHFEIRQFGRPDFVDRDNPAPIDIYMAREGMAHARAILAGDQYDVVILDEIIVALDFGLVELRDVLDLIESRAEGTELILTGRRAPQEIIEAADLVTEMKEVKHYYRRGTDARDGIEH